MKDLSKKIIEEHQALTSLIINDPVIIELITKLKELCLTSLNNGHKILFCGNGGSAADAQHIASELSGKFNMDRDPLYAEALHVNSSYMTAVSNDYGFEHSYSRLIKAKAKKGDILIGLSTSGNSANVVNAFIQAKEQDVLTAGWTGASGGKLKEYSDLILMIPSEDTPRIQEMHILIGHILCELIESELFA